jgi:hypothetical protein
MKDAKEWSRVMDSLSWRLDRFARRHFVLLTLATLTLAVLATMALLGFSGEDGEVIAYEGF